MVGTARYSAGVNHSKKMEQATAIQVLCAGLTSDTQTPTEIHLVPHHVIKHCYMLPYRDFQLKAA